jgi:protein involved in polysaccharide export with SLBB domain
MKLVRHLLPCLTVLLLAACSAGAQEGGSAPDSVAGDWSRVPEYRIVPGDKLQLNFGPRSDFLADIIQEARVRPDGRITVYPVGDVIAAGRTPAELEKALLDLLAPSLRNPRVTVAVAETAGNVVHVLGQVMQPKSVNAGPFMTVLQAVAEAGGFRENAARNSVLVFHREGARTVSVRRLRLDRAIKDGSLDMDVRLSPYDIVYVPRSTVGNIEVFARSLFGSTSEAMSSAILGWELFNLDRVFVFTR